MGRPGKPLWRRTRVGVTLILTLGASAAGADPRDTCSEANDCCLFANVYANGTMRTDGGWGDCLSRECGGCPAGYREVGAGADGGACCLPEGQPAGADCALVLGKAPCLLCVAAPAGTTCEVKNHPPDQRHPPVIAYPCGGASSATGSPAPGALGLALLGLLGVRRARRRAGPRRN